MFAWLVDLINKTVIIICCCLLPFFVVSLWYYIYFRFIKKQKPKVAQFTQRPKKIGILRRLFIDFPKQFVLDRLNADPDEFDMYGFHLFVGEQGSGKTVSVAEFLRRIKAKYPQAKVATNFDYKCQDNAISSWKDLIFNNNGIYGQCDVVDEVQNWFSSNQSKDFPPEMIQEITQQRKQRKIFIGTTQRFERMAKPLREQVNFLYYPITLAGCFTIVRVCKPNVDSDGAIMKLRTVRRYFFIHNDDLRNSFDTYKKIEKQALDGFNKDNRSNESSSIIINNVVDSKSRRKK